MTTIKSVEIVSHNGKRILYSDYSGLSGETFIQAIDHHFQHHRQIISQGGTDLLFLTNVENAYADKTVVKKLKETVRLNQPHIKKSALIGVVGIQRILVNSVNLFSKTDSKLFDSMNEALEWLSQ